MGSKNSQGDLFLKFLISQLIVCCELKQLELRKFENNK